MLDVQQALDAILQDIATGKPKQLSLDEALGLVLASDVQSDIDSPPHDKSMVDGYAVRLSDLGEHESILTVNEEVTAGDVPQMPVRPGTATRIMTGAPVPEGTEAVVMVENTEIVIGSDPESVKIQTSRPEPGANVMLRATSLAAGQVVLAAGARLRPIEIGLLAEVGQDPVSVIPPPTTSILSTGNELVPAGSVPAAGQIRNSNGPLLSAQVARLGGQAIGLGICPDDEALLDAQIQKGLQSDVLILSGGVSAGVLDLVPAALVRQGVQEVFHKVKIKPGKPVWYGRHDREDSRCHVFGLPGNPVSSMVCFEVFVRPLINRIAGRTAVGLEERLACLSRPFRHRGDRPTYHPGQLELSESGHRVTPLDWKGSADQKTLVAANCLVCFPAGNSEYDAGSQLQVVLLD